MSRGEFKDTVENSPRNQTRPQMNEWERGEKARHLEGQQLNQPWDPYNRETPGEGGWCKNNLRKFPRLKKGQKVSRRMNECNLFQGKSLENLGTPGKTKDSKSNKHVCVLTRFSRVQLLATPWTITCQGPPSMGFFRQEYWSGVPFPSPGDLPNPEIEPRSPALKADSLSAELPDEVFCFVLFCF